jgi:hypothetical protein
VKKGEDGDEQVANGRNYLILASFFYALNSAIVLGLAGSLQRITLLHLDIAGFIGRVGLWRIGHWGSHWDDRGKEERSH